MLAAANRGRILVKIGVELGPLTGGKLGRAGRVVDRRRSASEKILVYSVNGRLVDMIGSQNDRLKVYESKIINSHGPQPRLREYNTQLALSGGLDAQMLGTLFFVSCANTRAKNGSWRPLPPSC